MVNKQRAYNTQVKARLTRLEEVLAAGDIDALLRNESSLMEPMERLSLVSRRLFCH